jgi:hypothetical protein
MNLAEVMTLSAALTQYIENSEECDDQPQDIETARKLLDRMDSILANV